MDYIELFKDYLFSQKKSPSGVTVKNYLSDIRHFVLWFELFFRDSFDPKKINSQVLSLYTQNIKTADNNTPLSEGSIKRHISSLRKFFAFLQYKNHITTNPFIQDSGDMAIDNWKIRDFENYLYSQKFSIHTIKNYIKDIEGLKRWYVNVLPSGNPEEINFETIEEFKERLLNNLKLSPRSINRKLSSIRKYLEFFGIKYQKKQENQLSVPEEELKDEENLKTLDELAVENIDNKRLLNPLSFYENFESKTAEKIADTISSLNYKSRLLAIKNKKTSVSNIKKEFFAPLSISTKNYPFHRKLYHHIKYSRPQWYKKYHNISISHYLNFSILVIYCTIVGYTLYQNLFLDSKKSFAIDKEPLKTYSYSGQLTDAFDNPINTKKQVRFAIYNDATASGPAQLWEEVRTIEPEADGSFSVILASDPTGGNASDCGTMPPLNPAEGPCGIKQSIFKDNPKLFLGISLGNDSEFSPRQEIGAVEFAKNSDTLQGLSPITQANGETSNVILALDSSGNLTIGGNANPTFQATGGSLKLTGQPILLATNIGSNANILLSPDGNGKIDLQSALVNLGTKGNISPGGIEINDKFAVAAKEEGVAAFIVNNNASGDILTASSSGKTKLIVTPNGKLMTSLGQTALSTLEKTGATSRTFTFPDESGTVCLQNSSDCGFSLGTNYWEEIDSNTLSVIDSSLSIIIGSKSESGLSLGKDGTIQSFSQLPLTFGGDSTGDIILKPANSKGKVGINTSFPQATLDLQSVLGTLPAASISAKTSFAALVVDNNGAGDLFTASSSGLTRFVVSQNGNVGIGTTTPANKLEIKNADATNGVLLLEDNSGNCEAQPSTIGLSWSCSSDERLKENIVDAASSLDFLNSFKIRDYTVKKTGEEAKGVIAQEVMINHPEMVKIGDDGFLRVSQPGIWEIVNAIQELSKKDKDLELGVKSLLQKQINNFYLTKGGNIQGEGASELNSYTTHTTKDPVTITEFIKSLAENASNLPYSIAQIIKQTIFESSQVIGAPAIISPLAVVDQMHTNVISPLASNYIEVRGNIEVKNEYSNTVARIDTDGNASFSGRLTAETIESNSIKVLSLNTNEASVAGSLRAGKIFADDIEGLETRIENLTSKQASSSTYYSLYAKNGHRPIDSPVDISSFSAGSAIFHEGITSFGPATFNNLTAFESISIGTNLTISSSSINLIGQDLEIQPLRQGGISFLSGLVRIDSSGDLAVYGNADFAKDIRVRGTFYSNIISPLPNSDLVIGLQDNNSEQKRTGSAKNPEFKIQNSEKESIFSINSKGDVASSGSATFAKLNFSLASQAFAENDTTSIATGSAGIATLKQYKRELTVKNPLVTKNSLIYITPVGDSNNQVIYLLRQVAGESFTVGVSSTALQDIQFNWLIVN